MVMTMMTIRQNNIGNCIHRCDTNNRAKSLIINLWCNKIYLNTKLQKSYEYKFLKYMA